MRVLGSHLKRIPSTCKTTASRCGAAASWCKSCSMRCARHAPSCTRVRSASSRRRDKEPRRQVPEDPRTIMINKAVSSWFPARRPRIEWARPAPLILCHLGYAHSLRPSGTVCVRRAQYIYCATAPCAREPIIYHGCSLPPAAGASALMQPESAMYASLYPFSGRSLKSLTPATASYTTTCT
jgi:hypothetical protein